MDGVRAGGWATAVDVMPVLWPTFALLAVSTPLVVWVMRRDWRAWGLFSHLVVRFDPKFAPKS